MNDTLSLHDLRYAAISARDADAVDFFFAVRTTGVFCRPTCAARTPLRANVEFFDSRSDAVRAGYRACKRCRPELEANPEPLARQIDAACRTLEEAEVAPSLARLAANAGVSPFHFQRAFKKRVGVTPKQFDLARREARLQATLRGARTVTEAALDAGYASTSAMYDAAALAASMPPRAYRRGGAGERIAYATAKTELGWLLAAGTPSGICTLALGDDRDVLEAGLRADFDAAELVAGDASFARALRDAVAVVEGRASASDLALDIRGTAFQRRVWQALRAIPTGDTRTYAEIACAIGMPSAARAVGNAVGANALAVAIPCHRVVRGDGEPGGYRWGAKRKRALLERERKDVS